MHLHPRLVEQFQPVRIRETNRARVIGALQAVRVLSRTALAEQTGLSRPTINAVIAELLDLGIVRPAGLGHSTGGRPPSLLAYNPKAFYALGASLHNYAWSVVLTDLDGQVEHNLLVQSKDHTPEGTVQALKDAVGDLAGRVKGWQLLPAIGIGMSGLKDERTGTLIRSVELGWYNVPIRSMLEEALGLHTFVENRGIVDALAEYWHGDNRTVHEMIHVYVGAGISAGVFLEGKLYRGSYSHAGLLSHTIVKPDGPLCSCGNRGCLEAIIATPAIAERVRVLLNAKEQSWGAEQVGGRFKRITAEDVFTVAAQNDAVAEQVIDELVTYFGIMVTNLVFTFNPQKIVLGGPVSRRLRPELPAIRAYVDQRTGDAVLPNFQLCISDFGPDAGAIGGAVIVLQHADEFLFGSGG